MQSIACCFSTSVHFRGRPCFIMLETPDFFSMVMQNQRLCIEQILNYIHLPLRVQTEISRFGGLRMKSSCHTICDAVTNPASASYLTSQMGRPNHCQQANHA